MPIIQIFNLATSITGIVALCIMFLYLLRFMMWSIERTASKSNVLSIVLALFYLWFILMLVFIVIFAIKYIFGFAN